MSFLIEVSIVAVAGVFIIILSFVDHPDAYKMMGAVLATSMTTASLVSVRLFPHLHMSLSTALTKAGTPRSDSKVSNVIEMACGVPYEAPQSEVQRLLCICSGVRGPYQRNAHDDG